MKRKSSFSNVESEHLDQGPRTKKPTGNRAERLEIKRLEAEIEAKKKELEKKKQDGKLKKRRKVQACYDLAPDRKQQVKDIAAEYGTTASQIADFFIAYCLKSGIDPSSYLEPSASPKIKNNIKHPF